MICAVFPLGLLAQQRTEYNRKGDEAMKRLDYSDAKMWYEEGVSQCDAYSIDQLTTIWLSNERMRPSMPVSYTHLDVYKRQIVETVASFQIKVPRGVALTYPESLNSFLLRSDRIRLKQVLGNFITNAIKYTSIGRCV